MNPNFINKNDNIAIIGVSTNEEKYGYKVYIDLKEKGYNVSPINPKYNKIKKNKCYHSLNELKNITLVITIVKPFITEKIVKQCRKLNINKVWMQPGSDSIKAIKYCEKNNIKVIHNVCIMIKTLNKK